MSPFSSGWNNNMEAWVCAQNDMAVRAIIIDWFYALENGTAELRLPDPRDNVLTQDKADRIIQTIDDDFYSEHNRYSGLHVDKGPEYFLRLSPRGRFTMAQEILSVLMKPEQIEEEAARRIKNKETIPNMDEVVYYTQTQQQQRGGYVGQEEYEPRQLTADEQAALAAENEIVWEYYGFFQ